MEQHSIIFCIPIILLLIQTHSLTPHIAPTQPPKPSPTSPSSPSPSSSLSSSSSSPSSPSSSSSTTLDPKQIRALQSLNFPTKKDPCSNSDIKCDSSKPFRHLLSLRLSKCSSDVSLSTTALESLSTLKELQFINCSVSPVNVPSELASNLKSFTSINSFKKLSGVWLSHLENLTDLTVTDVPIKASGPVIIVAHMKQLSHVTISHANLSGELPGKSWGSNVSHIDLSNNLLKGKIPSSMTKLDKLVSLNLSKNQLVGEIPTSIGDLIELKNLSLSSNSLSGSIPGSLASTSLTTLDLGSNQFNGTIPKFISEMKSLKYLNLEKNNFQGVMPFNASFIKKLVVFKIGDNANLCYNHTTISSKLKLGIAKCDKNGFPVLAPAMSPSEEGDFEDESSSEDSTSDKNGGHHGPNKVVLGIAIALSSIVFLIIFLILLSRKCA